VSDLRSLVIKNGTTQNISNSDTLIVGTKVDAAAGQALSIGDVNATGITIGSALITTNFPGPVALTGDVTTVGGTTFTTDATFEGNVTFGAGAADTVTFAALTTVTSDINFGGAPGTFKITNLANGTNPNDAVNFSQLSALVTGVSSFQTSLSGLTPSSATGGAITLAGTLGVTSGGTGTTTAFTQGSVVFAGAAGVYAQDNASLFFDDATNSLGIRTATPNEALTVSGVVSVGEGVAPTATAAFGKLWANSAVASPSLQAADARPYWTDDTGQSYNLTLDRFNTLTPAASVAIDTSPALPVFNSLALNQNTTFTTSNLGNGRSASVRVICDGTTRTLTFPAGWTWLGSGVPPANLAAGDVGYLSITAYGATDADVVAAWSYENQAAPVTGTGVDNQIAVWSGTNTQDGSASLTFDGTTLGVTGAITQSGGAVSLTANAASSLTTSSGALTLTSAAAATWSTAAGDLNLTATTNSVVVTGAEAAVDAITLTASNAAGGIDVNAGTGGVTIDSTGGISVDAVAASNFSTSAGALTLTSAAAATWSSTAGNLAITGGAALQLTAAAGNEVVVNDGSADVDFRVESDTNTHALFVQGSDSNVGIGIAAPTASLHVAGTVLAKNAANSTSAFDVQNAAAASQLRVDTTNSKLFFAGVATTNTHTVNIGTSGTDPAFAIAAGGRIHYYDGSQPTNGQVLIGDTAAGNFAKSTLTAGSGVSITNGAGSITISATGAAAPVIDLTTTGLTAGDVAYVSSNDTASAAIATAAATARCAGLVSVVGGAGVGKVQVGNVYAAANFIAGLTALSAGQPVFLSKTLGKLTNDVSAFVSGDVVAEVGIVTKSISGTGGNGAADVLWQPKSIVVL
jgi:hypothetical protein